MLAPKSCNSSGPVVVTCQSCSKIGHLQKHCRTMNSGSFQSCSGLGSAAKSKIDYCFYYNRFPNPRKCSSNQKICNFDRVYRCSVCDKSRCASFKHRNRPQAQLNSLSTSHSQSQVQITSKITEGFDKLANKIDQISNFRPPTSSVNTMSCDSGTQSDNVPMFGMPSLVTHKVDLPNLANKHIMSCKVQSGGINLSLPLDSCCSVSLCSLDHAKHMQAKYPNYKWVKLPSPIPIHVANEDAGLQGIGMQDVRIDWGPGKFSIHTMLVVPKLSFPVRFGNNHLELCDAVVSHKLKPCPFISDTPQCSLKSSAHLSHHVGPMAQLKLMLSLFLFIQKNHKSCSMALILLHYAFLSLFFQVFRRCQACATQVWLQI